MPLFVEMTMELIECVKRRDKENAKEMESASAGNVERQAEKYSWAIGSTKIESKYCYSSILYKM